MNPTQSHQCDPSLTSQGTRKSPEGIVASGTPHEVLTTELLATVHGVTAEVSTHPATGAPTVVHLPPST